MTPASASSHGPILVTGASGFVGRRLVTALGSRGSEVRALVGPSSAEKPSAWPALPNVTPVCADLLDDLKLKGAVEGVSAVCHLAAFIPSNMADSSLAERCYRVNALGSLRLAEAALAQNVSHFVFASSANAYMARPHPVTEEETPYPAARATYYLASKVAAELYLEHLARTRALPLTTLRLSAVYGPGMPSGGVVARWMALAASGRPLTVHGGGAQATDFVLIDDIVDLFCRAVSSGAKGPVNAGSGEHTSLLALARAVARTYADRTVELEVLPPSAEPSPGFAALDITKARTLFEYDPRPLTEGLALYRQSMENGQ